MKSKIEPEVRFPEFRGDWELRKFKDFISKAGKKNTAGESYLAYSVSNKSGLIKQSEQFDGSRLDDLDKTSYKLVNHGDFAYNPARINVGSIAFNNLDNTVIVSSLYVVIKMSDKLDNEFILQFIKSPNFNKEVRRNTEGSVREYLFFENFKNIKFPYTSNKEEQIKIGEFLKKIDDTIALHQQELATLKQTKQGFLEKMFPKEGESVPDVRFPGFTENWVIRKLGDMSASFQYGLNVSSTEFDGENKYIRITDINDDSREFSKENLTSPNVDLTLAENYLLNQGDLLFARTGASVGKSYMYENKDGKVYYAGFLIKARIKPEYDYGFIYQNTLTSKYRKFINITSQRSGQPGVNAQEYADFPIMVPDSKEEQVKISCFLKGLDDTIALRQREVDALKATKKAFLQKMFV
ncbi:restriction endonuclease subunit S [Bacillus sp. NTK074B]|uniref:restriction endonuclease subunit S n=1 Tax=Bacillus sp. NTK074B TaxID=2802174 RepID=UPI001A8BF46E|nr:restriction endonuclease subunit S [Bacillus sp. NTK074B]